MVKFILHLFVCLFLFNSAGEIKAQKSKTGLISEITAQRYGLTRVWFTNVELDVTSDRIANLTLHSSFAKGAAYDVFEVIEQKTGRRYTYSQRDRGQFGKVLGPVEAKKLADLKKQTLQQKGITVTSKKRTIPHSILVAQTKRGVIHAIDAENGRTLWVRSIGKRSYPTSAVAVNDKYVGVVNGIRLYILNRKDGKLVWQRSLGNAPGAGPALTKNMVYIPMANGKVEAHQLDNPKGTPWIYASSGRSFVRMTATLRSVVWPTDRGHVYVARADKGGIQYRIETRDVVVCQPAYEHQLIIVGSNDGYVYATHELSGKNKWRYSSGLPISEQPAAIRDKVYVYPERGGVVCLDIDSGKKLWNTPRATKFLAASPTRLYMRDTIGKTLILSAKTGGVIDRFDTSKLDLSVVNQKTDRIYIGKKRGMIQCLREIPLREPIIYRPSLKKEDNTPAIIQKGLEDDQPKAKELDALE